MRKSIKSLLLATVLSMGLGGGALADEALRAEVDADFAYLEEPRIQKCMEAMIRVVIKTLEDAIEKVHQ